MVSRRLDGSALLHGPNYQSRDPNNAHSRRLQSQQCSAASWQRTPDLRSSQLLADNCTTALIRSMHLKNVLRQIKANYANLFHRRLKSGCLPIHYDTSRPAGASTPSEPLRYRHPPRQTPKARSLTGANCPSATRTNLKLPMTGYHEGECRPGSATTR